MNQTSERIGSRLHRLSEVSMMKQVEPLSYALFPGYHCPLMGAMLTIGKIRDAVVRSRHQAAGIELRRFDLHKPGQMGN